MYASTVAFASRKPIFAAVVVLIASIAGGVRAASPVTAPPPAGPAQAAGVQVLDNVATDARCGACAAAPSVYSVITLGGEEYWGAFLNQNGQVAAYGMRNRFFDAGRWYDLGSLGGGSTFVRALNNRGVVVGDSFDASKPFPNDFAFAWTVASGMRALPGLSVASATAINDRNQVAGYTWTPGVSERAVRWDPDRRAVELGPLPFSLSQAEAINESGETGGFADFADGSIHATKWTAAGDVVDLGSLGNIGFGAVAFLNGRGDAAGVSGNDGFFWSARTGMVAIGSHVTSGIWHLIGLGEAGEIVGNTEVPGGRAAFVWTLGHGLQMLPGKGATGTEAVGMNRRAYIVGSVGRGPDDRHAVRWYGLTPPVDLNAHLHRPPPGLVVTAGHAINDKGDIVAWSNAGILLLRPGTTGTDAPVLGPVVGLPSVVHPGDDLELTLGFIDNSPTQTHTVAISWDDGCAESAPPPALRESGGVGQVRFRHRFCNVGTAGVWIRIRDSGGSVTEVLRQTYVDNPAGLTLNGRGTLAPGGGAAPLHFALWVPLDGNAAAGGSRPGVPFVRLGGPIRFDSEQVAAPARDGVRVRVEGTGRLNGRPGYRFRLETVDEASRADAAAQLRVRVSHVDAGGEHVDYDNAAPALANALRRAGTGVGAGVGAGGGTTVASGFLKLSR